MLFEVNMVQSITGKVLHNTHQLQQPQTTAHNSGITGNIKRTTNSFQSNPAINQQNTNKVGGGIFKLKELKGIEKDVSSILKNMNNLLNNINKEHGAIDGEKNKNQFKQLSIQLNDLRGKTANYQKRLDDVGYKSGSKKRETLAKFEQKLNLAGLVKGNIESKKGYQDKQAAKEAAKTIDPNEPQYRKTFSVF
ncbi:hypothetical protein AL507_09155 [Providencia stuartii]|nr:hypothetical protein AL507_09155 [Providencia stuartii]